MNENRLFEELKIIKKLLAMSVIKEKTLKDQVRLLTDVGLSPSEISNVTGKNVNLIRVTKFSLKNKSKIDEDSRKNREDKKDE